MFYKQYLSLDDEGFGRRVVVRCKQKKKWLKVGEAQISEIFLWVRVRLEHT
jgi:Ni,Fe-hydrogenase maturation factor